MGKLYEFKRGDSITITTKAGEAHGGIYRGTKEVADYPCAIIRLDKETTPIPIENIANVEVLMLTPSNRGRKRTGHYLEIMLRAAQLDLEESEAREIPHPLLTQNIIDKGRDELAKLLHR